MPRLAKTVRNILRVKTSQPINFRNGFKILYLLYHIVNIRIYTYCPLFQYYVIDR